MPKSRRDRILDVLAYGRVMPESPKPKPDWLADFKYRWNITESTRQTPPWHKNKIVYVAPVDAWYKDRRIYSIYCSEHRCDRIELDDYCLLHPEV